MTAGSADAADSLELLNLGKSFGSRTALRGLSLSVRPGELIAVLGPSGSGKTTALSCIAGLLSPSEGEIWLDGRRIDRLPAERRGFGVIFQDHALFPHLTVGRNVAFGLQMRSLPPAEIASRVDEALELVRLSGYADDYPGQLSGGQRQRVAIARAIVLRPRLVLMDEPLSALDAPLRVSLRSEIKRIHHELGLTTIYVTHDQAEAMSLADRLVVLLDGEVRQIGAPQELHNAPVDAEVARFVGYRTMLAGVSTRAAQQGEIIPVRIGTHLLSGVAAGPLAAQTPVTVGFRPEDLTVTSASDESGSVTGTVLVTEYLGREFAVEIDLDGAVVHARSRTDHERGSNVRLRLASARARVFGGIGSLE